MMEHLSNADSLTRDEVDLFRRALAAVEGSPDAAPVLRELVESLLADRMRDLRVANEALQTEIRERRLVEPALRESDARQRDLVLVGRTPFDFMLEEDAASLAPAAKRAGKDRVEVYWRREEAAPFTGSGPA